MFSPKKLVDIRKRSKTLLPKFNGDTGSSVFSRSSAPSKGYFVVYTKDGDRFVVPLAHLRSPVFKELLKQSEEEFGLPTDGPITVPCDSAFMDYIMGVVQRHASTEMEKALLISIASGCCSQYSLLHQEQNRRKLPIYAC